LTQNYQRQNKNKINLKPHKTKTGDVLLLILLVAGAAKHKAQLGSNGWLTQNNQTQPNVNKFATSHKKYVMFLITHACGRYSEA
jgi:hypothetical protein